MKKEYDVIVFGAGTAGVVAAIQAARLGAATLLVEKNAWCGGTMTVGGINAPSHFFAWGKQIIAGIGWELVCRTWRETGTPIPDGDYTIDNSGPRPLTMDPWIFAAICEEELLDAGTELLYHALPAKVSYDANLWHVTICTKTGLESTTARTVIDCTGDANIVALAGFEVIKAQIVQPATLDMYCSGYDLEALDFAALKTATETAIAAGTLKITDISWNNKGPEAFLRRNGKNANHIVSNGAENSDGRTAVDIEAHRSILRMYRFFRQQPGLENFRIAHCAAETGIRESGIIKGQATITHDDYVSGRKFDDAICYAFYPIDEHLNDGKGINFRHLELECLPTIPRGALLPEGSRHLIAAGRCVSSDRLANSALRVQCPCMAMGQAAGALAALSVAEGIDPAELPHEKLTTVLRKHNAIVPK